MRKVLLVDDEPFISQGLKVLIDWNAEGYEIAAVCSNGKEAYEYLKENKVDLILADVKMPVMTGIELLEKIRTEKISDAFFAILTGFKDFSYVQKAMRYDCMDYLLKPVEKQELLKVIRKTAVMSDERIEEAKSRHTMEQAYLARNLIAILFGKHDEQNLNYVQNYMKISNEIRYVDVEMSEFAADSEELEEGEMRGRQREMFRACQSFLQDESNHCIFDVSRDEKSYDIGIVYCDYFAAKREIDIEGFFESLIAYIKSETGLETTVFVGKKVDKLYSLSKSYSSACVLKSLEAFRTKKNIYFYEGEVSSAENTMLIMKEELDKLINAIAEDDQANIRQGVDTLYENINSGMAEETVKLNVNYLLFRLIHMATELDSELNQEEIMRFISEHSHEDGILRGSRAHVASFCSDYADYLAQLRKNVSGGVLVEIEKEIKLHYMENLTLRDLGRKYFINSSYLGQIFQKKYNQSFKDYLTKYRIEIAKQLLITTDKRITEIAEEIGYKDNDYFLKKFIEANGCTPSKYRKNAMK